MPKTAAPEFHPAPGYLICKPVPREDLQAGNGLALQDSVGREKDSVGVARVIECGSITVEDCLTWAKYQETSPDTIPAEHYYTQIKPGDIVAYIPFTDAIVPHGFEKYSIISYKNVMARSPAEVKD